MNLKLKTFSQLIEDMGAALQSSATTLVDVSVGSVVRAIFEANASVVLWLQWLIVRVLQATRASTSNGSDLDSWMLDFGLGRLPAVAAGGIVTFSRFTTDLPAVVPAGTLVKTGDGLHSFSVVSDRSSSIWQTSSSSFVLPIGVVSADVPVVSINGGSQGNVLAGTINIIAASVPGIDQVHNANSLADGADPESDQAFRDRFQSFLISRSRATPTAVRNAIANVRQGLNVALQENTGPDGLTETGSFLVVVDDGTGYPSSELLSTIAIAVDSVRPVGTRFAVVRPQVLLVNVSMTAEVAPSAVVSLIVAGIQSSVATYLNGLPIGKTASVTRVAQNAYLSEAGVENVSEVQLNGLPLDIVPPLLYVVKSGEISVTASGG